MNSPARYGVLTALTVLVGCAGGVRSNSALDAELGEILAMLPGQYADSVATPGGGLVVSSRVSETP